MRSSRLKSIGLALAGSFLALGTTATAVPSATAATAATGAMATSRAKPMTTTSYPNSMDALGDSMTRAFNTDCPSAWTDCPANSWSTGTNSAVNSYYLRLRSLNPAIDGNNFNDAISGDKMFDLQRQASSAVLRNAGLVTILMGNNDACGGASGAMTSVSDFKSQFTAALNTLATQAPNTQVRVASLPDAYQLWTLFHNDPAAVNAWQTYNECNALLLNPTSTAQADVDRRAAFRQREIDYNTVLGQVCAQYTNCRYDGGANFNVTFTTGDVSTDDYFHPSTAGQAALAASEWSTNGF
ncbi:MAG TPA: SGNH/GDSL hydrolase family protein [Flexivirga sp.]|uniref:SGNH/GDSL hydrolase family protein n=1 Tax=Flexivirga sp. TaxID=1962927 RepID=UPI002BA062CC|nr:SGNH/GDSL hydrolase family protein [Flexivirga sp.]HWC22784.1 SGNH/GDSL hydrolase family protein [Flexivirga sp.]